MDAALRIGGRRLRIRARLLRPRVLVAVVLVFALLGGAWLWLRDSSLVTVQRVTVTGESGADAGKVRSALIHAARNMTTLDVHMDQLHTAVAPFPSVKDLRVTTQFPHGMRIEVIEQNPVGAIVAGGRSIAVAEDGTLLHDVAASRSLPTIPLRVPPGGTRLTDHDARAAVAVLAAAPYQMLGRLSQVTTTSAHGLVAQLRNGPAIYFGDSTRLAAKWAAAIAVLADGGSAGALYIDVSDPARPAAGASTNPAAGGSPGAAGTSASTATGGSSGTAGIAATSPPAGTGGAGGGG